MNKKIRVLSGIRASHSSLHLGNYFGAIKGMIHLQNNSKYETYYMVADLHGITTDFKPDELRRNRIEVLKDFVACGIDPEKSVLFLQSSVPEHLELSYLISSASLVADLLRMPSKKDVYKTYSEPGQLNDVSYALLGYPVLMAADILAYKASAVPIGLDQDPHLEFTREVARRLNNRYSLNFPEPKRFSVVAEDFTVPSILGDGKMSKSKEGSAIFLNESLEDIKKKVSRIPTDSGKGSFIPKSGDTVFSLFTMVELVLGINKRKEIERDYLGNGIKYSLLKLELAEGIYKLILPIQQKRKELDSNPKIVEEIIKSGAEKARKVAQETVLEVKEKMGLL